MKMRTPTRQIALLLVAALAAVVLTSCAADSRAAQAEPVQTSATGELDVGYHAAAFSESGFLVAGSGGRLDRIGLNGEITSLATPSGEDLCWILNDDDLTLVCGDNGTMLYSLDGVNVQQADLPETGRIYQLAAFGGRYFACTQGGRILVSENGQAWQSVQTETDRDLIGIAANDDILMAITAETDLLISSDGENWNIVNFNEEYERFYDPRSFGGLSDLGETLFVYGQMADDPGEPFLMYTQVADVWFFQSIGIVNGEDMAAHMPLTIHGVGISGDQLVAVCDRGRLLTITECTVCHQLSEYGESEWNSIAMGGGMVLLAGKDFQIHLVDENQVRQSSIGAEQALIDMQNGAAIVDVRTAEERAEAFIPGSIHIPLAELEQMLPELLPDKGGEIIFYCAAGGRSQTALEQALSMGYEWVYNLGGLADWPYDIEVGQA